jgi:hypothetical protein
MYELDLSSLGGFLAAMWEVAGGVMRLDPEVFTMVVNTPGAGWVALAIAFVAGISDMIGQSVVLFANRVSPRRFWISVVMSALLLILSIFFYAFSIWLIVKFIFFLPGRFAIILILVALSYAPIVFSFAALLPYLGSFIYQAVRIWSLLALVVGVRAIAGAVFWQGILACLLGWLFIQFIVHMPLLRIKAIDAWLWRVMTGTRERLDTQMLADRLAEQRGKLLRGNRN